MYLVLAMIGEALILTGFVYLAANGGTTLKMARFLWLTLPALAHPEGASAKGMWLPWLSLVRGMLAGVWLLPGALEVVPAAFRPEKHWDALWPLLAGGALAALVFRRLDPLAIRACSSKSGCRAFNSLRTPSPVRAASTGPSTTNRSLRGRLHGSAASRWWAGCWLKRRRASVPGRCPERCFSCCTPSW